MDKDKAVRDTENPFEVLDAKGDKESYYNTKESLASRLKNEARKREPVYRNSGNLKGTQASKNNA